MELTRIKFAVSSLRATGALCAISLLAAGGALAQDVGAPPPATNPQPQILGPTTVNPAPPPTPPGGVPEGDFFTLGKPLAPLGEKLANVGIYLKGFYAGTLYSVPSGGLQHTTVWYNDAFYGADFDLEKMAGIPGAVVHFSLDSRFGGFPQGVNNLTGSSMGFLQGVGPSNETRLNEFSWDQHLFNDRVRFVVGRTTLASYFGTSEIYCQFITTVCSNLGPFNWSANSNAPFWPISVWAGEVSLWPTKNIYLRAGASESNPQQYPQGGFPWHGGWGTSTATGVFVPVEVGYVTEPTEERYARKYDIGFYYDTSDFQDFQYNTLGQKLAFSGGTPAVHNGQSVIYAQVRQMIWRPDPSKPQGLTAFAGLLVNTSGRALIQNYFELGLVQHGTFPSRPNDSAGLLFLNFMYNPRATGAVNDRIAAAGLFGNVSNVSQIIELNYGFELAPGLEIKPYTDFTFHPDQNLFNVPVPNPKVHYAWAVGAQLSVLLNPLLGLPSFFRAN